MRCEIIAVGSELLSFGHHETNSVFLASRLLPLGIEIARKFVVGDRASDITETLALALSRSELVILTGGIGPTNDDITRETVAAFFGRQLREDAELIANLRRRYRRFGLKLTENNRRQAAVPDGARILENPLGTAPGLLLQETGRMIFLLPGPPRELHRMVDQQVVPAIVGERDLSPLPMRILKIAGEAESAVDARLGPIYREYSDIETTILSSPGIISLYFVWRGNPVAETAAARLQELAARCAAEMGPSTYSQAEETLAECLGRLLKTRRLTLATAESCTGGFIGKLITDTPGASAYFVGSVVAYADAVKERLLGVASGVIEKHGAVSGPVAEAMAVGVRDSLKASLGLSVTGVAGPDGGTAEKPVGTVYLGLATPSGSQARRVLLPGDRDAIRLRTSQLALDWVRRELL